MFISPNIPFRPTKETPGTKGDMRILVEDKWLMNTEVRYRLDKVKGMWQLTMIYIALENPFKCRCKIIDKYACEKKAKTFAQILQRGIRKDARGTLKTNNNAFHICDN